MHLQLAVASIPNAYIFNYDQKSANNEIIIDVLQINIQNVSTKQCCTLSVQFMAIPIFVVDFKQSSSHIGTYQMHSLCLPRRQVWTADQYST